MHDRPSRTPTPSTGPVSGAWQPVWDPFVRFAHWTLVIAFATAWLTAEESERIHVLSGYTLGTVVLLRILWGFVGPEYARFSSFWPRPADVLDYLRSLALGGGRHYVGHNPAGAAMTIALLLCVLATVGSGLVLLAADEGEGLFSLFVPRSHRLEEAVEDVHETLADLTLLLVVVHVAGVLLSSFRHRENRVGAMVLGKKRVPRQARQLRPEGVPSRRPQDA